MFTWAFLAGRAFLFNLFSHTPNPSTKKDFRGIYPELLAKESLKQKTGKIII
jgi:hypothetical protein